MIASLRGDQEARLAEWLGCCGRGEAFENSAFGWPRFDERFGWDASRRVTQGERHDDDVIEGTDDGKEFGDEVDG